MAEITRRSILLAPAGVLAACGRRRSVGFPGYAFVANQDGGTVAAVDLTSFSVARQIRIDSPPTSVVADPARPFVYVLTPESGCVHRIAVRTLKLDGRVEVARSVSAQKFSADGESLWVACSQPKSLVRIGLKSFRVEARIGLPAEPFDFDLSPDGKMAAVGFGQARRAGLIDLRTGTLRVVGPDRILSLVRFRSDNLHVLVGNLEDKAITILDSETGRLIVNLPLAVRPDNFCFGAGNGQLFVTGEGMDAAVIVYPYQTEVAETILAGKAPGAMAEAVRKNADFVLVANPRWGEVAIVDVDLHKVVAVVGVGKEPGFIAVTPDNEYALVLNRASGDMAVIRIEAFSAERAPQARLFTPLFTMVPVGSKPVCAAVRGV